ncbi:MAG: hypothetical protein ACE5JI_11395 [Acidobacteriota bacterium]
MAISFLSLSGYLEGSSFASKLEEIKATATPRQLYAFLYDLPKGADLHNHLGGAGLAETWLELATDPRRNEGQEFYTRVQIHNCGDCSAPLLYFHTTRKSAWKALSPCCRGEYKPMSALSPEEQEAWKSSVRLDRADEGREEFFEVIWPRLNHLLSDSRVLVELMIENMKLFAAEGVRYIEWQMGPFGCAAGEGRALTADELAERIDRRLGLADV